MYTVAMYLRLSLADKGYNDESNSIGNQRLLIREFLGNNFDMQSTKIVEYCDDGYSGTNFERPQIIKLLEEIKSGNIQCLIVKDLSRFSRDYIELGSYMNQIFPFLGVRFLAINDQYDSESHKGSTVELDTAFKTLVYDLYSKDLSEKVKTVIHNKYENGENPSGTLALGYERINHEIVIQEQEAEIVRYIFRLSIEGYSTVQIAKILYEKGIPTTRLLRQSRKPEREQKQKLDGSKVITWTSDSVRSILLNRFYIGKVTYGKSKSVTLGGKREQVPKTEWKTMIGQHQPLISLEDFEKTTIVQIGKRDKTSKDRGLKHPLVGTVVCGGCGYTMMYKPIAGRNRIARFECRKHAQLKKEECCTYFRLDVLEELILQMLNQQLLVIGDLMKSKESFLSIREESIRQLKVALKQSYKDEKQFIKGKDTLYERYIGEELHIEQYKQAVEQADDAIEQVYSQRSKNEQVLLQMELEYKQEMNDMKQVVRFSHVESLTKEVVDTFVKQVRLYRDKRVEIEWTFSENIMKMTQEMNPKNLAIN